MGKLKKALLALGGTVVGIATLRRVRKRRSNSPEEELEEVKHENPETASEHAKAAVEHTRHAVRDVKER